MIEKVYFDMDGVLVDFDQSLTNFTGKEVEEISSWGKQLGMEDPIGYIMNQEVPNGLFSKAPAMTDFLELKNIMDWLKNNNIQFEILSSASQEKCADQIIEQKKMWLAERDIQCPVNFVYGWQNKSAYATEKTLLIDDFEKCIEHFKKNNGLAIHHTNIRTTVEQFQGFFPGYISLTDLNTKTEHKKKIAF